MDTSSSINQYVLSKPRHGAGLGAGAGPGAKQGTGRAERRAGGKEGRGGGEAGGVPSGRAGPGAACIYHNAAASASPRRCAAPAVPGHLPPSPPEGLRRGGVEQGRAVRCPRPPAGGGRQRERLGVGLRGEPRCRPRNWGCASRSAAFGEEVP